MYDPHTLFFLNKQTMPLNNDGFQDLFFTNKEKMLLNASNKPMKFSKPFKSSIIGPASTFTYTNGSFEWDEKRIFAVLICVF